jgi:quercetin dioxygenase-like cupin family protein
MIQSSLFQMENEIPWEDLGSGVSRQIYGYDDKIMMVKVKFEKDAIGPLHEHPHTQVTYVESGMFEVAIGDKKKIIKKGDGFYVPPHAIHGVVCIEAGLLVDVFAPLRADFLPQKS